MTRPQATRPSPSIPLPTAQPELRLVDIDDLRLSTLRPEATPLDDRMDPAQLRELAISIHAATILVNGAVKTSGVETPIIARVGRDGRLEVPVGRRRLAAIRLLQSTSGVTTLVGHTETTLRLPRPYPVPVIVRDLTDAQMLQVYLRENDARAPLSVLQKADAYLALHQMGFTKQDLALLHNESFRTVERRLTLAAGLSAEGRALLEGGRISLSVAYLIASASGDVQASLLKAAQGMDVRELQRLKSYGGLRVEHALFDPAQLELDETIFGTQLPRRFRDPRAALMKQLEVLTDLAAKLRQGGEYAFVEVCAQEQYGLPDGYAAGGRGLLLTYDPHSGEVKQHAGVARAGDTCKSGTPDVPPSRTVTRQDLASTVTAKAAATEDAGIRPRCTPTAAPRASGPDAVADPENRRHPIVKEAAWRELDLAVQVHAAHVLLQDPRLATINLLVQMLTARPLVRLSATRVKDALKACPAFTERVRAMADAYPDLFRMPEPGTLFVHASRLTLLDHLVRWTDAQLQALLALHTAALLGGDQDVDEERAYAARLSALSGARPAFRMSASFLEGFTTEGLWCLVEQIPVAHRPIVLPQASKKELRQTLLDWAPRLEALGWMPDLGAAAQGTPDTQTEQPVFAQDRFSGRDLTQSGKVVH